MQNHVSINNALITMPSLKSYQDLAQHRQYIFKIWVMKHIACSLFRADTLSFYSDR